MSRSTETYVAGLPDCQGCEGDPHPAAYNAKTVLGPWANLCETKFPILGVGLGLGRGQRLIVGEKPAPTKSVYDMSYDELEELVGDGDPADFL